jgi:hypothetical protein
MGVERERPRRRGSRLDNEAAAEGRGGGRKRFQQMPALPVVEARDWATSRVPKGRRRC